MQTRKENCEKGNWLDVAIFVIGFIALVTTIRGETAHSLVGSTEGLFTRREGYHSKRVTIASGLP